MRFQCLGDDERPLLVDELAGYAEQNGWDIQIVSDSRVAVEVRNALTTYYAASLNPDRDHADILRLADAHARELGVTSYYSSTLVARPGSGNIRFLDLAIPNWLDTPISISSPESVLRVAKVITHRYHGRLGALPDGYWELGNQELTALPIHHLPSLAGLWSAGGATLRTSLHAMCPAKFASAPLRARSLYTTGALLLDTLAELRLVERPLATRSAR
jgi:hypothetical protein